MFFLKVPDVLKFLEYWPNVVKSLQQKCRDARNQGKATAAAVEDKGDDGPKGEDDDEDYLEQLDDDFDASQRLSDDDLVFE